MRLLSTMYNIKANMKIQYINPYVFRIEEYLPQEVFQYLEDYCRTCQFSLISNEKDFFCSIKKI